MKIEKFKQGELTTQQIVMIIILILSFAIILFFIFRLGLGKTSDREICHDSVVKKSSPVLGKLSGDIKCKTTYTCISGGGKCTDIKTENTVNVNSKNKDEIFKAIAEEMANCWWMFGEGKLDYLGTNFLPKTACAICSHIAFDDKIKSLYPNGISYKEFFDSLAKPMNIQKGKDNYLYYFYGVSTVNSAFEKDPTLRVDYEDLTKKIFFEGDFIIMTGATKLGILGKGFHLITGASNLNYIIPRFPVSVKEPLPECGGNFLTQG